MKLDLRYPNITGKTTEEQLLQTKRFLFQLVEQLNVALKEANSNAVSIRTTPGSSSPAVSKEQAAMSNFNDIKGLIIKSADIVKAYYDEIRRRLEGVYVAEAAFPGGSATYIQETSQSIVASSARIDQLFDDIQKIVSDVNGIENTLLETNANIRTGLLYYAGEEESALDDNIPAGAPVIGVEVGQETTKDGEKVFDKFARFTAFGLIFYDENGNEVAFITNNQMNIPNARISKSMVTGGFIDEVDKDGGIVTKWVGE